MTRLSQVSRGQVLITCGIEQKTLFSTNIFTTQFCTRYSAGTSLCLSQDGVKALPIKNNMYPIFIMQGWSQKFKIVVAVCFDFQIVYLLLELWVQLLFISMGLSSEIVGAVMLTQPLYYLMTLKIFCMYIYLPSRQLAP